MDTPSIAVKVDNPPSSVLPRDVKMLLSGGVAGALSKSAVAPLERLRIMAQTGAGAGSNVATARMIYHTEGVRGFWRGNAVNCGRIIPARGVLFMSNDRIKNTAARQLNIQGYDPASKLPPWALFASGSTSGLLAVAATYPLDLTRTRLAGSLAKPGSKNFVAGGVVQSLVTVTREEGVRGLFRGCGPTFLGAIPFEGIKFCVFGVLVRSRSSTTNPPDALDGVFGKLGSAADVFWKLGSGAAAGSVAGLAMYPNDTVRRMLQMQGMNGSPAQYSSAIDCWKQIFRKEGVRRFYRGALPYTVRLAPGSAIQFGAFEFLKAVFV